MSSSLFLFFYLIVHAAFKDRRINVKVVRANKRASGLGQDKLFSFDGLCKLLPDGSNVRGFMFLTSHGWALLR